MRSVFIQYIINLYVDVPVYVYKWLIFVFCFGAVLILNFCGFKKCCRYATLLLLVEYVILIFCSTVFFRATNESQGHDFHPFWSYSAIQEGRIELIPENVMNVVVFVPVGILLGAAFRSMTWWKALMIGGGVSVSIEAMQLIFKRGFSEVDDVMHNTLGCMIGYGVCKLVRYGYKRLGKRSVAVL